MPLPPALMKKVLSSPVVSASTKQKIAASAIKSSSKKSSYTPPPPGSSSKKPSPPPSSGGGGGGGGGGSPSPVYQVPGGGKATGDKAGIAEKYGVPVESLTETKLPPAPASGSSRGVTLIRPSTSPSPPSPTTPGRTPMIGGTQATPIEQILAKQGGPGKGLSEVMYRARTGQLSPPTTTKPVDISKTDKNLEMYRGVNLTGLTTETVKNIKDYYPTDTEITNTVRQNLRDAGYTPQNFGYFNKEGIVIDGVKVGAHSGGSWAYEDFVNAVINYQKRNVNQQLQKDINILRYESKLSIDNVYKSDLSKTDAIDITKKFNKEHKNVYASTTKMPNGTYSVITSYITPVKTIVFNNNQYNVKRYGPGMYKVFDSYDKSVSKGFYITINDAIYGLQDKLGLLDIPTETVTTTEKSGIPDMVITPVDTSKEKITVTSPSALTPTTGVSQATGRPEQLPWTTEGAIARLKQEGRPVTAENIQEIQKKFLKKEGVLEIIEPGIKLFSEPFKWITGYIEKAPPLKKEQFLGVTTEGISFYTAQGNKYSVLDSGWTPIEIDTKSMGDALQNSLDLYLSYRESLNSSINTIKNNPNVNDWKTQTGGTDVSPIYTTMNNKEAMTFYINEKNKIVNEIKGINSQIDILNKAKKSGYVIYTKEPNALEKELKNIKSLMKSERGLSGVEWVSSGMTARGLAEDPFSIPSTLRFLVGDTEGAIRKKASIRAARFNPEYRNISYERMGLAQKAVGKFFGGAAGIVAAPVIIPQMGMKYLRGQGPGTDVFGRIKTGKTIGPDVGMSIYEAGTGGKGQGLISVGLTEAISLGKEPAWEEAQQDPWGTFWATAGEIVGFKALGAGTSTVSAKLPRTYQTYMKYRPTSLVKGAVRGTFEGFKVPSFKGTIRKGISQIPRGQKFLERIPKEIHMKGKPGLVKTTGKIIKTPTMKRAIDWSKAGPKDILKQTNVGIKPFIRQLPKYGEKIKELTGLEMTLPKKIITTIKTSELKAILPKIQKELNKITKASKNLTKDSSHTEIFKAVQKGYGTKLGELAKKAVLEGDVTGSDLVYYLFELPKKGFNKEISVIKSTLKGNKLSLDDIVYYRYVSTLPDRLNMWANKILPPARLRHMVRGKIYRPQYWEFPKEVIQGKTQFIKPTEAEYVPSYYRGGAHATASSPQFASQVKIFGQLIDDAVTKGKIPKTVDSVLRLGNPVDDIVFDALLYDRNLVFTGGRALKLQSPLSIAKLKRFFGKELTDIDLIRIGGYKEAEQMAIELTKQISQRTGKNYKMVRWNDGAIKVGGKNVKVVHEGTYTIVDSAGTRVIDITSSKAPQNLGKPLAQLYGKEAMPIEANIKNIAGINVASPAYLIYQYVDMTALKSVIPKARALAKELDISVASGGQKVKDFGMSFKGQPKDLPIFRETLIDKASKYLPPPFKYKKGFVIGRGKRFTEYNPAQLELFHQSALGHVSRWMFPKSGIKYEPSAFGFGWGARPRVLIDLTRGVGEKEIIQRLKKAAGKGPAKGPDAGAGYMSELAKYGQERFSFGKQPQPTISYKLADIYRKGGKLARGEEERVLMAYQTYMKTGYNPLVGKMFEAYPSPRLTPRTTLGKLAEGYGETWGRISGWRHYTVDVPTGRTIRYYPTIPKHVEHAHFIGGKKKPKEIYQLGEKAQQPVLPKPELPKGLEYSSRHKLSALDIAKETAYESKRSMIYRSPYGYKAIGSRYIPKEIRETRRYKPREERIYQRPRLQYSYPTYKAFRPTKKYDKPYYEKTYYEQDYYRPGYPEYREPIPQRPAYRPPSRYGEYYQRGYTGRGRPVPDVIIFGQLPSKPKKAKVFRKYKDYPERYKEREFKIPTLSGQLKKLYKPRKLKANIPRQIRM